MYAIGQILLNPQLFGLIRQQVDQGFLINLEHRAGQRECSILLILVDLQLPENIVHGLKNNPLFGTVFFPEHSVGLAAAGLSIGEDRGIVTLHELVHQFLCGLLVYSFLRRIWIEHVVEVVGQILFDSDTVGTLDGYAVLPMLPLFQHFRFGERLEPDVSFYVRFGCEPRVFVGAWALRHHKLVYFAASTAIGPIIQLFLVLAEAPF